MKINFEQIREHIKSLIQPNSLAEKLLNKRDGFKK